MLEVESVSLSRFMSYGDGRTDLRLDNLGACLIVGEITADDEDQDTGDFSKRSNGAGKSALVNALPWCVFGRTMHCAEPGDDVINWFLGGECSVRTKLKNGDVITRKRAAGGRTELVLSGSNESTLAALSTPDNQQAALAKAYGLDWDIFCGSVYCSQFGKPWLELPDQTRKQIIERVLHVDRFSCYASVAKSKINKVEAEQQALLAKRDLHQRSVDELAEDIAEAKSKAVDYERTKAARVQAADNRAAQAKTQLAGLPDLDVDQLRSKWAIVRKIEVIKDGIKANIDILSRTIATLNDKAQAVANRIKNWRSRGGKVCTACEQEIQADHVSAKLEPLLIEEAEVASRLAAATEQRSQLQTQLAEIDSQLSTRRPEHSVREAEAIAGQRQQLQASFRRAKEEAAEIAAEQDPYTDVATKLAAKQEKVKAALAESADAVRQYDLISRHFNYIYRAYSDRRRAKSLVVGQYLPFFNGRLQHYLDRFELDFKVELTDALAIKTDKWKTQWMSGGERNSVNLSFMFAMFDLHEELYGRQCNVIVLDEVDGKLDEANVANFVEIVDGEIAKKVETVLVISHRNIMRDLFAHQITVRRNKDRISAIAEIR